MVNLIPVLLCTFSCITSSVSQLHTAEVQPGEEVTLQCSNFSRFTSRIYWFKLANGPNASCISSMISAHSNVSLCDGYQIGKFHMTSNTSVIFLNITQVDFSDSGLYFCGENISGKSTIVSGTHLKVQDRLTNLTGVLLGGLTVFLLLVIIDLAVRIRSFHTAQDEGQNPPCSENVHSDGVNYAAVRFHSKEEIRRSASQEQLE